MPAPPLAVAPVPARGGDTAQPRLERGGGRGGRHVRGAVDAALHPREEVEELPEEPQALWVGPRPFHLGGGGPPRPLHHRRQPRHLPLERPRLLRLLLPHLLEEQGVVVDQRAHQRHRLGRVRRGRAAARGGDVRAQQAPREDWREGPGGERGGDGAAAVVGGGRGLWWLLVVVLVGLGGGVVAGPPEEVGKAAERRAVLEGEIVEEGLDGRVPLSGCVPWGSRGGWVVRRSVGRVHRGHREGIESAWHTTHT